MINDKKTIKKLIKIQRVYVPLIPIQILQGAIYGTLRSIGKQNWLIIAQIFSNYILHFATLWYCLNFTELKNLALVISSGVTYSSMVFMGLVIIFTSDWSHEADKIRMEMNAKEIETEKIN